MRLTIREHPRTTYSLQGETTLCETTTRGEKKISCHTYNLREISYPELMNLRLSKRPGFVMKKDGKLYYTDFPYETHFSLQNIGAHLCQSCEHVCKDCQKVADWTVAYHIRNRCDFRTAVMDSGRIEKYKFIPYAIETFNCQQDAYLILACTKYEKR